MNIQKISYYLAPILALLLPVSATAVDEFEPIDGPVIVTLPDFTTLTVTAQGGRIVSHPAGIDCDNATCSFSFVKDSYVSLAAVAGQNYNQTDFFQDWTGDCSGSLKEACRVKMTSDKSTTGSFAALGQPVTLVTLTVNVGGVGDNITVVSDPEGINCSATDNTCTADFSSADSVALSATPSANSNGIGSTFFNWTGDCTSDNTACVVTMGAANKSVTANYIALSTQPAFALNTPSGANKFYHHPRVASYVDSADDIQPFGIGQNGNDLRVKLPPFGGAALTFDVYLGITVTGNDTVFLITPANDIVELVDGLVAWKEDFSGAAIDETIFANLPYGLLPTGTYNFYVMVTPANNTDDYYLWKSYRNNNATVNNPFIE